MATVTVSAWVVWVITISVVAVAAALCFFAGWFVWELVYWAVKKAWKAHYNKTRLPVAWGIHDYINAMENGAPEEERQECYRRMRSAYEKSVFAHGVRWGEIKRSKADE